MKKILGITGLTAFFVMMCWIFSYAIDMDVWLSSHTTGAVTTQNLCPGQQYLVGTSTATSGNHGVIHGICVNQGSTGTVVTVYNSSATANNIIFAVAASTPMPCSFYDVAVSSGLTYSNTGGVNDITLLYQCY